MSGSYWLIKGDPDSYGWANLVADGGTEWDGVRNAAAANNLRAMAVGDEAIFYHSGSAREAVGVVRITRGARPDGPDGRFVSVRVEPVRALPRPVTLSAMKSAPELADLAVVRQPRLSVSTVSEEAWTVLMRLAGDPVN
jgi:predicted RNA-binding protein with PUA-like domain